LREAGVVGRRAASNAAAALDDSIAAGAVVAGVAADGKGIEIRAAGRVARIDGGAVALDDAVVGGRGRAAAATAAAGLVARGCAALVAADGAAGCGELLDGFRGAAVALLDETAKGETAVVIRPQFAHGVIGAALHRDGVAAALEIGIDTSLVAIKSSQAADGCAIVGRAAIVLAVAASCEGVAARDGRIVGLLRSKALTIGVVVGDAGQAVAAGAQAAGLIQGPAIIGGDGSSYGRRNQAGAAVEGAAGSRAKTCGRSAALLLLPV
jgi:hypothetical protein